MPCHSFAECCLNKHSLSSEAKHTVEVLLNVAGTSECHEAERILSQLTNLALNHNQLRDLSPLQTLTQLTSLYLGGNQIRDLSPLQTLTQLTSLYLFGNQIRDLSPLQRLTNLTHLNLAYNQISDLAPLQTLTNLMDLYLTGNQIRDLSPLQRLTNLTDLDLDSNQIVNLSPLQRLTNLTSLHLENNQISDLSPLQRLTNLTSLHLENNQISDLSPLQTVTKLTHLNLKNNQISDLSPLQTLTNLTYLYLFGNQIRDLSPLQTLTNLTLLDLRNNQIRDLSPLQTLTNLTDLDLDGNQIRDLSPLQTLTNLTYLFLSNNQIKDLSPLQALTHLTDLFLDSHQIGQMSPPLRLVRQEWQLMTLSTQPLNRQKARQSLKSAYTLMGKEESEMVFCPSPQAAKAWLHQSEQLGTPLRGQLLQLVNNLPTPAIWERLHRELRSQPDREISQQLAPQLQDDSVDSGWVIPADLADAISLTQFCVSHFGCQLAPQEREVLHCLSQLVEHCGWIYPLENLCVACDRPRQLRLDDRQRLHAEGEPAIEFADGESLYSYHGVTLPAKYGQVHPNQWQASWLLQEQNAERRRVLIQGIGYTRICQQLQAIELDAWQEYALLEIADDADVEPIHLLKMTCPSTGLIHALRVPPELTSAREAIGWVNWGTDPQEFSVQT